jgi:polyferredoxin
MKKRQKLRMGIILFSFFLFPATFYYLSPVLIVQAASQGIMNGSFIIFALQFMSALLLGRAFCGWACPAAGCQEALFLARDRKITRGDFIKWLIWVPWIGIIAYFVLKRGGYEKVDFLYETTYGISVSDLSSLIAYFVVLFLLIVLPAYTVGRRSFCHHLCWMAPFMILGRKVRNAGGWPSLRLAVESEKCTHCHTCTQNCPMSLPVEGMVEKGRMENAECILCGSCVDGCKYDVLRYSFRSSVE